MQELWEDMERKSTGACLGREKMDIAVDFSKLKWFTDSPDAGYPDCICSLCGKVIPEDEVPVRMWNQSSEPVKEIRLHWECFVKVKK